MSKIVNAPLRHFDAETKSRIETYVESKNEKLADIESRYFSFIDDQDLKRRLASEFYCIRYIYKVLQGLQVTGHMQSAQVRFQIMSYASIYEACLHHLLFHNLKTHKKVEVALRYKSMKRIAIPEKSRTELQKYLEHDGQSIVPMIETEKKVDLKKMRFDDKAKLAFEIGLISEYMKNSLIELYSARNAIHIHAELEKGLKYELKLSKEAFKVSREFRDNIIKFINRYKKGFENLTLPLRVT